MKAVDYDNSPTAWFVMLETARQRGDFARAAEAQLWRPKNACDRFLSLFWPGIAKVAKTPQKRSWRILEGNANWSFLRYVKLG